MEPSRQNVTYQLNFSIEDKFFRAVCPFHPRDERGRLILPRSYICQDCGRGWMKYWVSPMGKNSRFFPGVARCAECGGGIIVSSLNRCFYDLAPREVLENDLLLLANKTPAAQEKLLRSML